MPRRFRFHARFLVLALLASLAGGATAWSHEVDQYTLPPDKEFIDLGCYWNKLLYNAVQGAVDESNLKLRAAQALPEPARGALLDHWQSHDTFAWTVRRRLPTALWAIDELELKLRWQNAFDAPPGKTFGYFSSPFSSVYSHMPDLPDPRQLGRIGIMRCSLIKVHDTYMGTDKVGHFIAMGYMGFTTYRNQLLVGVGPEKALRQTILMAEKGPLGEAGILGFIPTGIYSNADMAANYVGMKYYQNLMEPVMLKGQTVPPMVVVRNDVLALNPHVRPDSPYFAQFISSHMDEVLNPSLYESGMRDAVRCEIQARSKDMLGLYVGGDRRKDNPEYFDRLARTCATYYGEEYGHSGDFDKLITLADTCFPSRPAESFVRIASDRTPRKSQYATATDRGPTIQKASKEATSKSSTPRAEPVAADDVPLPHQFAKYFESVAAGEAIELEEVEPKDRSTCPIDDAARRAPILRR